MANFEAVSYGISSSINLLFLRSDGMDFIIQMKTSLWFYSYLMNNDHLCHPSPTKVSCKMKCVCEISYIHYLPYACKLCLVNPG